MRQIETNSGKFRQIETESDTLKLFARYRDENLAPAAAGLPFEQDCPRVRWNPPFFNVFLSIPMFYTTIFLSFKIVQICMEQQIYTI